MKTDKELILDALELALGKKLQDGLLVSESPEKSCIHSVPRFLLLLSGGHQFEYYDGTRLVQKQLSSGSWLYCSASGYLYGKKPQIPSENLSISFYGKYIRALHTLYGGAENHPALGGVCYHTNRPLSKAGICVLQALEEVARNADLRHCAPELCRSLLRITAADIRRTESAAAVNSVSRWIRIDLYLRENREEKITRESVAEKFKLSPGHVSHLFKRYSGRDFNSTLTLYRLEHGANLLNQSQLSIDEIAYRCGYKYTSYFIRRFRGQYGVTPSEFRKACMPEKKV